MSEKNKQLAKVQRDTRKELKRLTGILEGITPEKAETLKPVAENTAWIKVQLDRARELIADSEMIVEYDNGGGQTGIRENPAFKAYEALWKAYISGIAKLLDAVGTKAAECGGTEPEKPENVLELIRAKHTKGA